MRRLSWMWLIRMYVVDGVTTPSIGSNTFMMRGMPGGRHIQDGSQPCPPAFWSAVFHSKIFWYSGVSGAVCPALTQRGGPTRSHLPFRSGYLLSSNAAAPAIDMTSAASDTKATIERRYCMTVLPFVTAWAG